MTGDAEGFRGVSARRQSCASPLLASMTLTGNTADLIVDALASVVDWVDACLVVDTGVTDNTLDEARHVAGEKYVEARLPWVNDFAVARNFALFMADGLGAHWAVTLDTDERLHLDGSRVRALLPETEANVLSVFSDTGTYAKQRFFRLPAAGRFVGPSHECFIQMDGASQILPGARFSEVPKSDEQYEAKFERDAAILSEYSRERPNDPRWLYYLGDSLQQLGRFTEAIGAYGRCAALHGWDEEAAWACYRSVECWLYLEKPDSAVAACASGLCHHAGVAELPWLAAYASWRAGRPHQAVAWARLSIAAGNVHGSGSSVERIGFRNPFALYEGPYDVLRFALHELGDNAGADEAERVYREAAALRIASGNGTLGP